MSGLLNIDFKIDENDLNKIKDQGREYAKRIALRSRELLTRKYRDLITEFYAAYKPSMYKRQWDLYNTYKPYYSNPHNTTYRGGVEISSERMLIHKLSNDEILDMSLEGIHGNYNLYYGPDILNELYRYADTVLSVADILV